MNRTPKSLSGLWPFIRPYRRDIGWTLALAIPTVGLQLFLPWIVRNAVDALADGALLPARLTRLALLYLLLAALSSRLSREMRRYPLRAGHRMEFDLREALFGKLTTLDASFFQHEPVGDLMTRMTSDLAIVRDFVAQGILQGIRTSLAVVMSFSILFAANARLALTMLALFPVTMITFYLFLRRVRPHHDAVQSSQADVSNMARETFSGIRTVKSFALEDQRESAFRAQNARLLRRQIRLTLVQQPLWPLFAFWFSLAVALILKIGGADVIRERMTLGTLVLFIQYMLYMQWPLLAMSWVATLSQRGRASWQRIRHVLSATPAVDNRQASPDEPPRPCAVRPSPPVIRFRNVQVRRNGRTCLDLPDLTIPAGQTLGITGPTGAGKSLLATLVPRLYDPDSGHIEFDGQDLRTIHLAILRHRIGYVAQEPMLFSGSMNRNLALGLAQPDPTRIRDAVEAAGLADDIRAFPAGYDTPIGERGMTLSGGQRQRAALARALARDPEVLILDDALAAVDTQTESAILSALRPRLRHRTTLLISHRVSTLRTADRIAVIENGRLSQLGSHAELSIRDGYYRRAHRLQRMSEVIGAPP